MCTACCEEPHAQSIVVAAVVYGSPACSHAWRVTLFDCSPAWVTTATDELSDLLGRDPGRSSTASLSGTEQRRPDAGRPTRRDDDRSVCALLRR